MIQLRVLFVSRSSLLLGNNEFAIQWTKKSLVDDDGDGEDFRFVLTACVVGG